MQIYKEEIVVIDGVKMQKITVDQTTVVFKKLETDDSEEKQIVPEVIDKTPKLDENPPVSDEWKFSCVPCNFYTNDKDLYVRHNNDKEHRKMINKGGK